MRSLPAALVLALSASCTMGPDYERPPVTVPANWKEASPNDQSLRGDWWELFRDPTLSGLVRKALDANQTLAGEIGRAHV